MKRIINLFILCGIVLLGVCGCSNNKITNDKEINKNEEVKEDIDIKENETDTKDNDTNEDVNLDSKEDTKPTISNNNSNNTSTTNDEKQEITVKQENTTNKEDTKQENIDYNVVNNSFKREYMATESEIYGYIHSKIIQDYCIPLVPEGSLAYDYCDVLFNDGKYSEQNNDYSFLNLTKEEILSIEAEYYNEAIANGKNIFTDIYTFKDDGTLTKNFVSKMEYWVLSKEINGTYSKIGSNTYYYNINYNDNGIIYMSQNHFCKNNNNCNESDKYKKQ